LIEKILPLDYLVEMESQMLVLLQVLVKILVSIDVMLVELQMTLVQVKSLKISNVTLKLEMGS